MRFIILFLLLVISIFFGVGIGAVSIPLPKQIQIVWQYITGQTDTTQQSFILLHIRLIRVLVAGCTGMILALGGTVMQGIFRNPLADTYLLGIASGASAGAAFFIALGYHTFPLPIGSFAGGMLAVFFAYQISRTRYGQISNHMLILAGIGIGSFFSSITTCLLFTSQNHELRQIVLWVMGSLAGAQWNIFMPLFLITLLALCITYRFANALNAFSLGDPMAQHLGVPVEKTKKILLCWTTFFVSFTVSITGPIGFIGLIVPHIVRMLWGPDHRKVLPVAGVLGACFLIICDTLGRSILSPIEIPVGIVTAICGAPFFLYILKSSKIQE